MSYVWRELRFIWWRHPGGIDYCDNPDYINWLEQQQPTIDPVRYCIETMGQY